MNPEYDGIVFEDDQESLSQRISETPAIPESPGLIQFLIKKRIVKNERQATVLISIVLAVIIIITVALFFISLTPPAIKTIQTY